MVVIYNRSSNVVRSLYVLDIRSLQSYIENGIYDISEVVSIWQTEGPGSRRLKERVTWLMINPGPAFTITGEWVMHNDGV
jgi:hypothetical protein